MANVHESRSAFEQGGFEMVGIVTSEDLDDAYRLTNHIERNWTENDEVATPVDVEPRSTSVGDIFVLDDGVHLVSPSGFTKIKKLNAWEQAHAVVSSVRACI
jgi:hypothetical protein